MCDEEGEREEEGREREREREIDTERQRRKQRQTEDKQDKPDKDRDRRKTCLTISTFTFPLCVFLPVLTPWSCFCLLVWGCSEPPTLDCKALGTRGGESWDDIIDTWHNLPTSSTYQTISIIRTALYSEYACTACLSIHRQWDLSSSYLPGAIHWKTCTSISHLVAIWQKYCNITCSRVNKEMRVDG